MANGKLLRQLILSGVQGDAKTFRAASEAVIREEREKNHHLLANDLEHVLYGDHLRPKSGAKSFAFGSDKPVTKDSELALLEERPAVRDENDIVLSGPTKVSLNDIVTEHNRSDLLKSYGLQPAQKLLFCGPPGCGKTLAAEVIAHALSLPLLVVRLDAVISSFLGETASNLRKVFDYISKYPVVALFDEFDALSKDRGDAADHGELKRSVNTVLQMMDAYRGSSVVVATTNYDALLDHAVWRRFDEVVRFEMPGAEQVKQLLAYKLSGIRRNFDTEEEDIAALFEGFSYADIERVLRRAVKDMVLSGRNFLEKSHLAAALAREYRR